MNDTGIQKNQQIIWTQEKTSALSLDQHSTIFDLSTSLHYFSLYSDVDAGLMQGFENTLTVSWKRSIRDMQYM